MKKSLAKKFILHADSQGGLELSAEFLKAADVKTGDEYAAWKVRGGIMMVFTKNYRGKRKIPKHALWGKVEPALPEHRIELPIVTKPDRKRALQILKEMGPVNFKPRKPQRRSTKSRRQPETRA
jgi:hypothetical protein